MLSLLMAIDAVENDQERELIGKLFDDYAPRVYHLATRFLHNQEDAKDAVNETFLRVIHHRQKFIGRPQDEIKRLLVICTRSVCIDMLRKEKRRSHISLEQSLCSEGTSLIDSIADNTDVLKQLIHEELCHEIQQALNQLAYPDRDIVRLRFYFNMRTNEIAGLLGLNPASVRTKLYRSIRKMRKVLEKVL